MPHPQERPLGPAFCPCCTISDFPGCSGPACLGKPSWGGCGPVCLSSQKHRAQPASATTVSQSRRHRRQSARSTAWETVPGLWTLMASHLVPGLAALAFSVLPLKAFQMCQGDKRTLHRLFLKRRRAGGQPSAKGSQTLNLDLHLPHPNPCPQMSFLDLQRMGATP